MEQVISQNIHITTHTDYANDTLVTAGLFSKFMEWSGRQEESRMLWLGIALMVGIGTVLPITLIAIVFCAGNNFSLWIITCAVNVPVLIVNLATQPTKVTLPALFFAWLIDAIIIAYCVAVFFLR